MTNTFNRLLNGALTSVAVASVVVMHSPSAALAQQCTAEQLATSIDQAGATLRDILRDNQPKLDQKIKALKAKNNWPDADAEEKALEVLGDARTAALDRTANDLLARIDQLGNLPARATPECGRLQELEAASLELQAAVKAKSAYMLARADILLNTAPATPPQPAAKAAPSVAAVQPPLPPPAQPAVKTPPPALPSAPTWSTTTTIDPQPAPQAQATQPQAQALPAATPRDDDTYTIDEIIRASTGVFGKVSAGLGSLVEHTFSQVGRPTGYIIGQEGGGAFLAGLRYGSGTLYLRDGRTMPIHWHGPSLGLDIGAQGAKIMFLVYRLRDPEQLAPTFTSIEGSAFVAGGIGVTMMTNGDAQLAPIRSGIGLRLGASVGYVRFTRKPTWNPF
jgi:hypothetical protein